MLFDATWTFRVSFSSNVKFSLKFSLKSEESPWLSKPAQLLKKSPHQPLYSKFTTWHFCPPLSSPSCIPVFISYLPCFQVFCFLLVHYILHYPSVPLPHVVLLLFSHDTLPNYIVPCFLSSSLLFCSISPVSSSAIFKECRSKEWIFFH